MSPPRLNRKKVNKKDQLMIKPRENQLIQWGSLIVEKNQLMRYTSTQPNPHPNIDFVL